MRKNLPQKQDKNKKQSRHMGIIGLGVITLALCVSCSNTKPLVSIDPLERNALSLVATTKVGGPNEDVTKAAIQAALSQYAKHDNLLGQWRIHQLRAKLALQAGRQAEAEISLEQVSWLAEQIDDPEVRYQTELSRGRIDHDNAAYRRALSLATTPLQAATAHTYLNETKIALRLIEDEAVDTGNAGSLAFIYYQHAKFVSSSGHYLLALIAYRLAGDSRGIADTLLALAKLNQAKKQSERAEIYARRAIAVLEALGESKKALAVRRWLSSWQLQ